MIATLHRFQALYDFHFSFSHNEYFILNSILFCSFFVAHLMEYICIHNFHVVYIEFFIHIA